MVRPVTQSWPWKARTIAKQMMATTILKKVRGRAGIVKPETLMRMTEKDQTMADPMAQRSPMGMGESYRELRVWESPKA